MSHLSGIVSTFSGVADPSLGYSGLFASGIHDGLCACDNFTGSGYNFYIEPYYSGASAAKFYMTWGHPSGMYFYPVYGVVPTTTSSVSTFSNYDFDALFNGLPIPNIGSNYTSGGAWYYGSLDSVMAQTGRTVLHLPDAFDSVFKGFRTSFTGIEDHGYSDPFVSRPYIPYLPHSLNGQINACPQSCFEIPYFAATNQRGHFGMRTSDSGVDLFPPLKTGSPSAQVDLANPTFPSGLIFYSYGIGNAGNKRYFSPNYFLAGLSGQFSAGVQNPVVFLASDPGDSLYPNGRFSCKEPLIIQHPIDTYAKIGGKAHYRAFALDWDGLDSDELKYQWYRTLKTQYSPIPIPPVIVNGTSNGATTPDLTVMEIDLRATVSGVIFTNYGKHYVTPPTVTLGGGGSTVGTALINGNGDVTGVTFSSLDDINWTIETSQAANRSPSISFSASPSGSAYTASGLLIPNPGFNNPSTLSYLGVHKSGVVRGVVKNFDENFYYFCRISNPYFARDTEMASLTIESGLQFPLITSNRSYFNVDSFLVKFEAGNLQLDVNIPVGIGGYAGITTPCDAHKTVPVIGHQIDTVNCQDKPISSGFMWPEQAGVSLGTKDGDCWKGVNHSWYSADGPMNPHGLYLKSGSPSLFKVDYGNFTESPLKNLTQAEGDLLYGIKALPICSNFGLIHSGVTVDIILTHSDGFTQKHMEQSYVCPGFLNEYSSGLDNAAYCSLRHPTCYGEPAEVYHTPNSSSASLNTLGCIGAFTSGESVFCPGVTIPQGHCDRCGTTEQDLWDLFDGDMLAGTGCGFRNPVLRRKHYISLGSKEGRYYSSEPCCAGLNQAQGTYLKDAGIQYNWLTYPRDSRLQWTRIPDSAYGFKWEYDEHGRDKYNNGQPSNFVSTNFKDHVTLYDHISNFGLYTAAGLPVLHPRPLYELGYNKNTCSGCSVADPCADKSNDDASYLTPILEVKGNPYRRVGYYGLQGGWVAPEKQCTYFSFFGKLERRVTSYVCCSAGVGAYTMDFYSEFIYATQVGGCGVYDHGAGTVEYSVGFGGAGNPPYFSIKRTGIGTALCELGQVGPLDGVWDVEYKVYTPTGYATSGSTTYDGEPCGFAFNLTVTDHPGNNCTIPPVGGPLPLIESEWTLSASTEFGDFLLQNDYIGTNTQITQSCSTGAYPLTGSAGYLNYTGEITDSHCKSYILKDITTDCFTDSCYPMKPIYVGSCIYNLTNGLSSGQGLDMVSGLLQSRYGYNLSNGNAIGNYLVVTSDLDAASTAYQFGGGGGWHTTSEEATIFLPTLDQKAFLGFGEVDNLGVFKSVVTRELPTWEPVTGWSSSSSDVVLAANRTYEIIKFDITYSACMCGSMFSGYTISTFTATPPEKWYDAARRTNILPHQDNSASFLTYPTGGPADDNNLRSFLVGL